MLAQAIRQVFGSKGPVDDFWYQPASTPSTTGINVGDDTALAVSTFWACLRVLGDTVGALPVIVYEKSEDEDDLRERATDYPWYSTLHLKPNAWQTPFVFKSMMMKY
jgi:phage portal protein BeeE